MYGRLYQQCNGAGFVKSSVTKFLPPDTCNYYIVKKQIAPNLIPDAKIIREYQFPCKDYSQLANLFKEEVKKETGSETSLLAPESWGPGAWKFLTAIAFAYPENPSKEEQEATYQFFSALQHLLPCKKCKTHFKDNIDKIPLDTSSKDSLTKWVVDFHNLVNESLGKSKVEFDKIAEQYRDCAECSLE